jgi:hypothetical protein
MKQYTAYFILVTLICAALLAGCADTGSSSDALSPENWVLSATPEYVTEWPDNDIVAYIHQPANGTIDYVYDMSDDNRYGISLRGITRAESEDYVEELKQRGYREVIFDENEASAGLLMKKENILLNISYAEDGLAILINLDGNP